MGNFSDNFKRMFLELDICEEDKDTDFKYHLIKDDNNEYSSRSFLKYSKYLDFDEFVLELRQVLSVSNHFVNDTLIVGVLSLFNLMPQSRRNDKIINDFFLLISKFYLKQYVFFDGLSTDKIMNMNFNDFSIGKIDFEKFENFVYNHSASDYISKYRDKFGKNVGLEVKSKVIACLDIYRWMDNAGINIKAISFEVQTLVNLYLNGISEELLLKLENDFEKKQRFITAYFGVHYDINDFRYVDNTVVNVFYGFLNNSECGWVHPSILKVGGFSFPDNKIIKEVNTFMKKHNDIIFNSEGEYSRHMVIVSEYFSNAEKHIKKLNFSLAFVELFIGLDFLLAPDTEKSKKLKRRISLLVHFYFGNSLLEQEKILDRLYDSRSNYIHNGIAVEIKDVLELRDISKIIFAILFNLHLKSQSITKLKYSEWLDKLDRSLQMVADKNILPNEKEKRELGVFNLDKLLTSNFMAQVYK